MGIFLHGLLPPEYVQSELITGAYTAESNGVSRSMWLVEKDASSGGGKYLMLSVDAESDYWHVAGFRHNILEASVIGKNVCSIEGNLGSVSAWNDESRLDFSVAVREVALPWLDQFGDLSVVIDFLCRAMVVGIDGLDEEHKAAFGSVIMQKQYDPPRVRKLLLGLLATLCDRNGDAQMARKYLEQFLSFYEAETSRNSMNSESGPRRQVIDKILSKVSKPGSD